MIRCIDQPTLVLAWYCELGRRSRQKTGGRVPFQIQRRVHREAGATEQPVSIHTILFFYFIFFFNLHCTLPFFFLRLFTFNTMVTIIKKYGLRQSLSGKVNLQADIANNRRGRESKPLVPRTTEQSLNTLDLGE